MEPMPIWSLSSDRCAVATVHGGDVLKEVIYAQETGILPSGKITQIAIGIFPPNYSDDNSHVHKTMWQFDFVFEGWLTCVVEDKSYYTLQTGGFLAVPPGMRHRQMAGPMGAKTFYFGLAID